MLSIAICKLIIFGFIALNIFIISRLFPDERKPKRKARSRKV